MAQLSEGKAVEKALNVAKEVELSNGAMARIFAGKGKHARKAAQMAEGDQSKYLPALMQQLIEINGEKLTAEDFDEMPLKDYTRLSVEFQEQNF